MARAGSLTAFFTPSGVTYSLLACAAVPVLAEDGNQTDPALAASAGAPMAASWRLQQEPIGGQAVLPVSDMRPETVVGYLRGKPESWIAGVATYRGVTYPEVWPGIDV